MTHVWHVPYYTTFPAIWTFAHLGDVENVIEWLRIRALHSPDQIESKMSFFGDTMDLEARGGEFNTTPLHAAVVNGHAGIVLRLIAAGADLSPHNHNGDTPLIELVKWGGNEENEAILMMVKLLLQFGADVNRVCTGTTEDEVDGLHGYTVLMHAIISFPQAVPMLLAYGADVEARRSIDFSRDTPIIMAVLAEQDVCLRLLLEYGADLYARDSDGNTVLGYLPKDEDGNYLPYTEDTDTPASRRVLHLVMAEVQRRKVLHQDKCEAFAMGKIERLGAMSRVFALDSELVCMICDKFCL